MPRVPHKKIKAIIQSAYYVIRKRWLSVPPKRKCTVSWPRGYFKTKKFYKDQIQIFFYRV